MTEAPPSSMDLLKCTWDFHSFGQTKKKPHSPFKMMNDFTLHWQKHINTRFISDYKSKSKIFLVINTSFSLFAVRIFDRKRIHVCRIVSVKLILTV